MIERYVFLRFNETHATPEGRAEAAARSREILPTIPGVKTVRVGTPADDSSEGKWDLVLAIGFDALEDVEPYVVHPIHTTFVNDFLKPRVIVRKAWNFVI